MKKLFAIARITKPAGLKGEVKVRPLSRYFNDYVLNKPLFLGETEELSRQILLKESVGAGKQTRYHFEGIDSRDEAESMIGQVIFASVPDSDKILWISGDIIGFVVVTDTGKIVGELAEILWLPSNDIYVIRDGSREMLIPVIPEIVKKVDVESGVILISPVDGLLG
ncbi:MAG: 16S rRNA processing protein RimM [Candidatus Marinimicrobia bacterium]|nr:16S rRNA processing protein RimM [Candidatus Neomarinimicrobiota bacterium]MBL7059429.1 16S rRNA processing protein RimM [Candidatus Neomarinimicrobiota bacterium]